MRTIGILGGMAWPSSIAYYRLLNEEAERRLGGHHSARCVLLSVDFAQVEALQAAGDWEAAGELLAGEARRLDAAGAEILLLATNTMHRVADAVVAGSRARFLHIADAMADELAARRIDNVGLLGTRYTMEGSFYRDRLAARGITVVVPEPADRDEVHRVIYQELVHERVVDASRRAFLEIIGRLVDGGARAIALACTEIMLLVRDGDAGVPLLDTTALHCRRAIDLALA